MAITIGTVALIVAGVSAIGVGAAATNTRPVQSSKPDKRRTRDDYSGTSFTMNFVPTYGVRAVQPIKSIAPINTITPISDLNNVNAVQPITPINPTAYHKIANKTIYEDPTYNYYNDPYQVNSLADVLFNREGKNLVLEDIGMEWATHIPVVQELVVGINYLKESYVDPIARGDFVTAGINALMDTGETLDIVANPIKGLILDGPQGFVRGLGAGAEGRTQYDYDVKTGNGILDFGLNMAAEIASDPVNWFTFGGKSLIKETVQGTGEAAIRATVKETGQEIAERTVKKLGKNIDDYLTIIKAEGKELTGESLERLFKMLPNDDTFSKALVKDLQERVSIVSQRRILQSATAMYKYANKVDDALLFVTPLGQVFNTGKKVFNANSTTSLVTWVKNKYTKTFNKALLDKPVLSNLDYDNTILKEIKTFNKTLSVVYDEPKLPNFERLTKLYRKVIPDENGAVSVDRFVKMLVDEKIVDADLANKLLLDPKFIPYFNSIAQKATLLDTMYNTIIRQGDMVDVAVHEAIIKSKDTYGAIENVCGIYRRAFGLTEDIGLKDIDEYFKKSIKEIEERIGSVTKLGDNDALEELMARRAMLKKARNSFRKTVSQLGIPLKNLNNLPSDAILRDLKGKTLKEAMAHVDAKLFELDMAKKQTDLIIRNTQKSLTDLKNKVYKQWKDLDHFYDSAKDVTKTITDQPSKQIKTAMIWEDVGDKIKIRTIDLDNLSEADAQLLEAQYKQGSLFKKGSKKIVRSHDDIYNELNTLSDTLNVISSLQKGPVKESILKRIDELDIAIEDKQTLQDLANTILESKNTTRTINLDVKDYKNAKAYLKAPAHINKVKAESATKLTETLRIMQEYTNHNTDLLTDIGIDTNNIEAYLLDDSVPKAVKKAAKKVIEKQRKLVQRTIDDFIADIQTRYGVQHVSNNKAAIEKLQQKYAKEIDNWNQIQYDKNILDTIARYSKQEHLTDAEHAEYIKALEYAQSFPAGHANYVENAYKEMTDNYVLERIASYYTSDDFIAKDIGSELEVEIDDPTLNRIYDALVDLELKNNKEIETAMELLNEAGAADFDVERYHAGLIKILSPDSKKMYILKTNQAVVHQRLLSAYESNPVIKAFVADLANDTNETVAGYLFNYLSTVVDESTMLSFSQADIKNLKEIAKAQTAYSNLLTRIMTDISAKDPTLGLAFIDAFAGYGYRDKIKVLEELAPDGEINYDKIFDLIDMRYNSAVNQYTKKNEDLAKMFGMDTSVLRAHDAADDGKMTAFVHQNLIDRKVMPAPEEGQIFTYYDFETTGKNVEGRDQILQIAASKYVYKDNKLVPLAEPLNLYIRLKRGYTINDELIKENIFDTDFINNIRASHLDEEQAINTFMEYADGTLVGHNVKKFDNLIFKSRSGIELADHFEIQDTLEGARKLFGAREVDMDAVHKIGDAVEQYLHEIDSLQTITKTISIMDAQAANRLFDVGRDLADIILNHNNPTGFTERLSHNVFTEAIEDLLGKTDLSTIRSEFGTITDSEILDVVTTLDVASEESVIKQIRDILTDVKKGNEMLKEYIITDTMLEQLVKSKKITSDLDIGLDYQLKLNIFGLTNNVIQTSDNTLKIDGDFHFSEVSARSITTEEYTSSLKRAVANNITEPLQVRETVMRALDVLDDPSSDWVTKFEASKQIAAYGYNYTQASRLKSVIASAASDAKTPTKLSDRIKHTIAVGRDEIKSHVDYAMAWAKKANLIDSKTYKELNQDICINDTLGVLASGMTPQQFTAYLTDQAGGLGYIGDITNPLYQQYVKEILDNEAVYNQLGYKLIQENNGLFILPYDRAKVIANSKQVAGAYNLKHIKRDYSDKVTDLFKESEKIHLRYHAITGGKPLKGPQDFASKIMYADSIYSLKRGREHIFAGTLLDDEEWITMFYTSRVPRYSYGILGSLEGRRMLDEFYPQPLNNNITMIEKAIKRVDGRHKFIELYFNNDLGVNGSLYADLTDEELLDMYKASSSDNVFMILVEDKKTKKPVVRTFKPNTVDDIKFLRRMDGVLTTQYNANSVINTINKEVFDNTFDNPVLQFWYKYIVSTYKSIYLTSVGAPIRNFIDIIVKNAMDGALDQVPESLKQFFVAVKDWYKYEQIMNAIQDTYGTFDANTIAAYFNRLAKTQGIEQATELEALFREIHEYATSNIGAGMSTAQEAMLKEYYTKYGSRAGISANEWYTDGQHPSAFDTWFFEKNKLRRLNTAVMEYNTIIEHGGRIANMRMSLRRGLSHEEAYGRALKTHFDYGVASKGRMYAELLFPFVTFPMYNLQYWCESAFKNPALIELLLDMSRTSLDIEQQKQYTLDHSTKLQAAILNGNIRIGNMMFKVNPSLFDAYQMLVTPTKQIEQRLIAPVKVGVEALKQQVNPTQDYVTENDTNLSKIGLGEVEKILDEWGLYSITRAANNVLKGVATLDNAMGTNIVPDDMETIDSPSDVVPSLFSDFKQNYGARLGENFTRDKIKTTSGTHYITSQSQTGVVVNSTFYPTKYPKVSYTAGRSYNRIPSARRYYSPRRYYPYTGRYYNWYKNWKAKRVHPYYITQPASAESLQYMIKNLLYGLGMDSQMLRAFNERQFAKHRDY